MPGTNTISIAATGDLTVTGNGIVNNNTEATVETVNGTEVKVRYTMFAVDAGGKLTIENGTFTTKAAQIVYTYGSTTIRGGTFKNTSTNTSKETVDALNSGALIVVCGTPASLTMTDGTVTTESQYLYGVFVRDGGNAIFGDEETKNGPSIHTHRYAAIGENNTMATANITIYGGEYTVSTVPASDAWKPFCATIYASASGEINIHGGTFTGYYAISDRYEKVEQTVTITGGTFNGAEADLYVTSEGGKGTTTNRIIAIAGGTFGHKPDATYIATGYVATANTNGTWTVGEKTGVTLVAQVGVNKYESLADALAAAENGDTVKLVSNTTLTSSVEINKSITLDLNGKTIRYTGENQKTANPTMSHRALNVTSGTVTIKNGAITTTVVGTIYPPQDNPQAEGSEFDAIIVKSGAVVTLEDMNITINDKYGSCLYVFEGGKATVKSGSYTNKNTSGDKLLLNQKDLEPQAIFVEGGTFDGRNPKIGDNSDNPSTFLAEGYEAVENEGKWTVKPIFAGGTGTAEDPFVIQNAEQFKAFRDNVNAGNTFAGKTIELMDNIDLSSVENWVPIGNESGKAFAGTFDGNNKTISNLKITSGGYIGLFGYVDGGAAIKNVNLVGANVSGTERVGGLIGEIIGNTTVSNCSIDETSHISGTDSNTGGLIGAAINGTAISLSGLTNRASVTNTQPSTARAGGIIGQVTTNANVTITDCHNEGAVTATGGYAGGIVSAYQHGALTINRCANSGTLTGAYKGNLVAWITSVRSLSISVQDANVEKMIGLLDKDYKRNITINGTAYFLNEKDDPFTFESALGDKELLDTVKIDKIIDFYRFAKTKIRIL